jgi:sec-independent protein translocase protein TatC
VARTARPAKSREGRMTLGQHLVELRRRLVVMSISILIGSVGGYFVSDWVLSAMSAPIHALAKQQHRLAALNYPGVTSAFDLKIQIAITVGIIVSSPVWLYQIWAFFVPGLTKRELRYGLGFFLTSVPLFLAGCLAGWLVVPHIVELLTSFAQSGDSSLLSASDYFDFILKLMLAIGIAFVMPVFLVLLNFIGILSAKVILKSWRIALLLIVVFTAIATPSADVVSMFLLAIPMIVLYFAAAAVAAIHDRRASRAASAFLESDLAT